MNIYMHSALIHTTNRRSKTLKKKRSPKTPPTGARTKKRSPKTPATGDRTKKRSPKTPGMLISNDLPYPQTFNTPGLDYAKFDVESEIATVPIICLKKPITKWNSKETIVAGYELQNYLSKKYDFVCKIYQLTHTNDYVYSWQEAGVSLKKYLIDNPTEKQSKLAQATTIIKTLYETKQQPASWKRAAHFIYTDKSVDNFIIIDDKVKIIDFEQIDKTPFTQEKMNALKVTLDEDNDDRPPPKNKTPMPRTSSPPLRRTSSPPTPRTS
jgi:hypothetical protein